MRLGSKGTAAFLQSLASGHCQKLQYLNLHEAFTGRVPPLLALQALRAGHLLNLPNLPLGGLGMVTEHGEVLGEAIAGGALSKLKYLDLSHLYSLGDTGLALIMTGFESGT